MMVHIMIGAILLMLLLRDRIHSRMVMNTMIGMHIILMQANTLDICGCDAAGHRVTVNGVEWTRVEKVEEDTRPKKPKITHLRWSNKMMRENGGVINDPPEGCEVNPDINWDSVKYPDIDAYQTMRDQFRPGTRKEMARRITRAARYLGGRTWDEKQFRAVTTEEVDIVLNCIAAGSLHTSKGMKLFWSTEKASTETWRTFRAPADLRRFMTPRRFVKIRRWLSYAYCP